MPLPDLDLTSLTIDERLRLIDALWESIEQTAANGDADAVHALEQWADRAEINPDFLAELEREADELEKDPSKGDSLGSPSGRTEAEAQVSIMATIEIDPGSLSIDERLELIDKLWLSIAVDAGRGDERAKQAVGLNRPLDPEVLAEIVRRAEALKRDPSSGVRWEDLRVELRRKYG